MAKEVSSTSIAARVMTDPLPSILQELEDKIRRAEEAAEEAKAAQEASKMYAAQAKGEAKDAVLAEVNKLLPRITEAQGTAGKALQMAKAAQASADKNSESIMDLSATVKNLADLLAKTRAEIRKLAAAVVNGMREAGQFIATECSDLVSFKD